MPRNRLFPEVHPWFGEDRLPIRLSSHVKRRNQNKRLLKIQLFDDIFPRNFIGIFDECNNRSFRKLTFKPFKNK